MPLITMEEIKDVSNRIVEAFHPEKIILFGSYAYGQPTEDSDVDLMIIMPLELRGFEQAIKIRRAVDIPFACDLVVKTPQDAKRRYEEFDPIVRYAIKYGVILYERDNQRVA